MKDGRLGAEMDSRTERQVVRVQGWVSEWLRKRQGGRQMGSRQPGMPRSGLLRVTLTSDL